MDFATIKKNLEKKFYKVSVFDTSAEAVEYLNKSIDNETVGFGGSMTLRDLGLYDVLNTHNQVTWHMLSANKYVDETRELQFKANAASIYLSSVNAIAKTGEIVNIDGTNNRVAGTLFGHKKVYFVVGKNKITEDCDSAVYRARNVAAPLNAKRLGSKTPCAKKADKCYDCSSPGRICRSLCILMAAPMSAEYEVVLINEDLGF